MRYFCSSCGKRHDISVAAAWPPGCSCGCKILQSVQPISPFTGIPGTSAAAGGSWGNS